MNSPRFSEVTVYSYPLAAVYDIQNAAAVLKVPAGGIPAGSVICIFAYGSLNASSGGGLSGVLTNPGVGDSAGNIYKFAFTPNSASLWFMYTYNSKALRTGDTITVRKFGPMLVYANAYYGMVSTKDPLVGAAQYDFSTTIPNTPAPAGDVVVAGMFTQAYGTGSQYIEDTLHGWSKTDFTRLLNYPGDLSDIPMFASSLVPRPAGAISWKPQIIPFPTGYGWESITAGFSAAVTIPLTSIGFTVGSPTLLPGSFSIFGKVVPIGITVGSPFIEAPSTMVEAPQVVCLTHRDDPEIMEALHTNYNVAFSLEVQPNSLVGRTSPGVGAVERINVVPPLLLIDKSLNIDQTFNDDQFAAILARLAAVEIKAQAALDGVATVAANLATAVDALTALTSTVVTLQAQVKFLNTFVSLGSGVEDVTVARPQIGSPILRLGAVVAASLAVQSPGLGIPIMNPNFAISVSIGRPTFGTPILIRNP
jgi:hypothetical protein